MAYVLGLISADGAVEDVRDSSRTCYFTITNVDEDLMFQVKETLNSSHKIYEQSAGFQEFNNGTFFCAKKFILRVGSKTMVQDLINLGITPRKSLRLKLPKIPDKYFRFYLRGYFDGDGCTHVSVQKGRKVLEIAMIFTSGCESFLDKLNHKIYAKIGTSLKNIYFNSGAFRLRYGKSNSLKILSYMYDGLNSTPYLARKYKIYQNYLNSTQID